MGKSIAQKDLAGHTKELRGSNVAREPRVGHTCANSCEIVIDILLMTKVRKVINLQLQASFNNSFITPAG